jgi:tetratricopeptide (TPR) repeat protein
MLFELRGRGRRRTIQAIYLGLAIVLGGGLVLFGVGTGGGGGGLLNAFNPNSGTSAGKAFVSQQAKNAAKQVKLQPNNPQAWANLTQARYEDASQGFDSATQTYTAAGKADLQGAAQAWQRYLQLDKHPDATLARLMGQAYQNMSQFSNASQAWQIAAAANPTIPAYWYYVAVSAYLAKNTSLGDLAAAKTLSLTPKAQRSALKTQLDAAKARGNPAAATTATPTTTTPTTTSTTGTTTTKSQKKK